MIEKKRTPEEEQEFAALFEKAWSGVEMSREEKIRANILLGYDQEWAEWIADHGIPRE